MLFVSSKLSQLALLLTREFELASRDRDTLLMEIHLDGADRAGDLGPW